MLKVATVWVQRLHCRETAMIMMIKKIMVSMMSLLLIQAKTFNGILSFKEQISFGDYKSTY